MEFLTSGFNVLLIILGFGVLIFIHELGHFIAAKWANIRTEAFAVGMGPVMVAWRKGIGVRLKSTQRAVEDRVHKYYKASGINVDLKGGDEAMRAQHIRRAMDALNIGETEYSLRWLPIGGFVKMLGQEDANPNAVSDDPRSYTRCGVGKRMIVVSAGVIMNILLALVLFVVAFMRGVAFDAPVVGSVGADLPAGRSVATNAAELGVQAVGLQPGDEVIAIDGETASTFADVQIASAMSKPGVPVHFTVRREGVPKPLEFVVKPEKDQFTGLLSIGIAPGASTTLRTNDEDGLTARLLVGTGLADAGIRPGMRLVNVNGTPISTYGQLDRLADSSGGRPLETEWIQTGTGEVGTSTPMRAALKTYPTLSEFLQQNTAGDVGLIGLSPLIRVTDVLNDSDNVGVIKPNDIIIRVNDVDYPRRSQLFELLQANKRGMIRMAVVRDGAEIPLEAKVNRDGQLLVGIEDAEDLLLTAQPIATYRRVRSDDPNRTEEVDTPIKSANLFASGGTTVLAVNGQAVSTWAEFRHALRQATAAALERGINGEVQLTVVHPTAEHKQEDVTVTLSADQMRDLHSLGWHVGLPPSVFEPIQVTRAAGGNPMKAISMGFAETKKLVVLTYLTIDRLVRGSVGVDQLRGPVGIVHIGTKVIDRGFMYLLFFLGMISVNLAVINFLPIPIVDGGLFLFLVYEKFKGRPPSLAFQNVATIVGLCLIGALFLITFYNDVLRLLS